MGNPFFIFYVDMDSSQDILVLQTSSPEKRDFSLGFPGPWGCENSRPGQGVLLSSGRLQEARGHLTELWMAMGVAFQHCPSLQR